MKILEWLGYELSIQEIGNAIAHSRRGNATSLDFSPKGIHRKIQDSLTSPEIQLIRRVCKDRLKYNYH